MSSRSYGFNSFKKKALKSFKNSYIFTGGGVISTLGIFKPKGHIKYSRLLSMYFIPKDFRVHLSQVGEVDIY